MCHVNYGVPAEYEESHLPGAIHLDTNTLESSRDWNRRPPPDLRLALLELGITHDTTVIVWRVDYDLPLEAAGPQQGEARTLPVEWP